MSKHKNHEKRLHAEQGVDGFPKLSSRSAKSAAIQRSAGHSSTSPSVSELPA